ncbi:GNAT family N-acetyltransferase [Aeromicrobium massiliense]|uniref:GNAT family N-acetyltransferase n=1 Tax=Aeromicrobium massiliense TaxID=1464554 RepID=UPI0002E26EBA|nr:GNAT family N-acetyltransferase [Aeromicrobium massiliense]
MRPATTLTTARLRLRPWRAEDREPFAVLNADPVVMEHFPSTLDREQSDALADRIATGLDERGWGLWALEVPGVTPFAGFVGLAVPRFDAAFTPAVEVGWRLARPWWGRGYAPEAAREAVRFGLDELGLEEVVSFTAVGNARSRRVMEKVGLTHDPADDFDHPDLPDGHRLRRHVLYRGPARTTGPDA